MKMRLGKSTKIVKTNGNGNSKNGNGKSGKYEGSIIDGSGRLASSNGNSYQVKFKYRINGKVITDSRFIPESVLREYGKAAIPLSEGFPIRVIVSEGKLEKVCDSQDNVIFSL